MLSNMLKEMFNEKEQLMLEYMATHYLVSYYEYHRPLDGSNELLHVPTKVSANELAKTFNINEEDAKKFFENLENKKIGTISISKLNHSNKPEVFGNYKIYFDEIGDETQDRRDKNTIWFFEFNKITLQCEIIKPTVDELHNAIVKAASN